MEEDKKQYLSLLSEIIAKMVVIFGSDIVILKAKKITGLSVDDAGNATDINGDVAETIKRLVDSYMELSGLAIKGSIDLIFVKYPQIRRVDQI